MEKIKSVGIVGLGQMGRPMSQHLLRKGFEVVGCDPLGTACDQARALGVRIVDSPGTVAAACDVSIVIVGFESEVETAVFGEAGIASGAKRGHIVAVGSTVSPSYAGDLARRLAERGIVALDVPSARGEPAALAGRLLVYGAGEERSFEACRPVFEAFASPVHYLGPAGAGQVAKMVNNLILWACTSGNDEGLRLGQALGVDPDRLRKALHDGSAQNWSMDNRAEDTRMPWAEKDMMIVLSEADRARISLPLCGTIKETIKDLKIRMGFGMPSAR